MINENNHTKSRRLIGAIGGIIAAVVGVIPLFTFIGSNMPISKIHLTCDVITYAELQQNLKDGYDPRAALIELFHYAEDNSGQIRYIDFRMDRTAGYSCDTLDTVEMKDIENIDDVRIISLHERLGTDEASEVTLAIFAPDVVAGYLYFTLPLPKALPKNAMYTSTGSSGFEYIIRGPFMISHSVANGTGSVTVEAVPDALNFYHEVECARSRINRWGIFQEVPCL